MREFIEQERRRLQELFDGFVGPGSYMAVRNLGDHELFFQMAVDNLVVTRVQPKFDSEGKHTGNVFWVMWNGPDYHYESRYTHTIRVHQMESPDTYILEMWGNSFFFVLEKLMPDVSEPEKKLHEALMAWRERKAAEAELFARIDAELLAEHKRIADTWPED